MWDIAPSWQNDIDALKAAGSAAVLLAARDAAGLAGYAAFFPAQGALAQCAVRADRRRQGLGRLLIATGQKRLGLELLRVINVDPRSADIQAFLTACGAKKTVSQKELMRDL